MAQPTTVTMCASSESADAGDLVHSNGQHTPVLAHCFDHVLTAILGAGARELENDDGAVALRSMVNR